MTGSETLLDKLWSAHEITQNDVGKSLLWVDRHLVHEGSHHAFAKLVERELTVAEPALTFAITDHYAPTKNRFNIQDESTNRMIRTLKNNAERHGIEQFDLHHAKQGIVHVVGPELGITLPGLLVNCGDSHTSTHGAFGCLAFGIGATEVAHVLATQTVWQSKPKAMRLRFDGELGLGVTAKDLALHWIAKLGSDSASGCAIEYCGSAINQMSMEARMTLCNLSIEGGARMGMIAPDETTFQYVQGKAYAPAAEYWQIALEHWRQLKSDDGATFDREFSIDANTVAPTVTWGTNPEQAAAVNECIPYLEQLPNDKAAAAKAALDYMDLKAGQSLYGVAIDQVFIGSCTNARIEDLRAAASLLVGKRTKVPGLVSPGSSTVKKQAEEEGLHTVFTEAGLEWVESGCSLCVGMNGDTVASGKRCASSTNRNFRGRQGRGSRTHLMSPAMVAAAAIHGCIVDVREQSFSGDFQ